MNYSSGGEEGREGEGCFVSSAQPTCQGPRSYVAGGRGLCLKTVLLYARTSLATENALDGVIIPACRFSSARVAFAPIKTERNKFGAFSKTRQRPKRHREQTGIHKKTHNYEERMAPEERGRLGGRTT